MAFPFAGNLTFFLSIACSAWQERKHQPVTGEFHSQSASNICRKRVYVMASLSGVPDYFGRNKISSGGDLSHYSSASLY